MILMYPGAYVDFRDEFDSLTTIQQLRIYCAGVWHNVVLTAIAIGIISSMNTIMFPFYKPTEGVMITDISMVFSIFSLLICLLNNREVL